MDIDESRTEQKREGPDGKEVCYNPPRYEYSYDFEVIISVNNPYFDEMKFCLNNSSVYIEPQNTMQRPMMGQQGMMASVLWRGRPQSRHGGSAAYDESAGMNQRPMAGRPQSGMTQRPMMGQMNSVGRMNTMAAGFDPESNREYRKYREMGDEIRAALLQVMETGPWRRRSSDSPHAAEGPHAAAGDLRSRSGSGRPVDLPRLRRTERRKALRVLRRAQSLKTGPGFWA